MSAELALVNQLLVKALKTNSGSGDKTFKVPVNSGNMDISEGDYLQIGPDGLAYPSGFKDSTTPGIITTASNATSSIPKSTAQLWLNADTFVTYISTTQLGVFQYNTSSGLFEVKQTYSLAGTIYVSVNYSHLSMGVTGTNTFYAYYNPSSTAVNIELISWNASTFALTRVASKSEAHNSYSQIGHPVRLDDTRTMFCHYNSGGHYIIAEEASDGSGFTLGTYTSMPNGLSYINGVTLNNTTIFWGNSNSYVNKLTLNSLSGTAVTIVDASADFTSAEKTALSSTSANNIVSAIGLYTDTNEMSFLTGGYNGDNETVDTAFCRVTSPNGGVLTLTAYKPDAHSFGIGRYTPTRVVKTDANTYFAYITGVDNNGGYGHKLYKIILDDSTKTYTTTKVYDMPFSDTSCASQNWYSTTLTVTSDNNLVGGKVMNSPVVWETVKIGGDEVHYIPVDLIATADIPANSTGTAITGNLAFEQLGETAGSNYLGKYMITDTNYAVSIK